MQKKLGIGLIILILIVVAISTLYSKREQNFMTSVLEIESKSIDGNEISIVDRTPNDPVKYKLTGEYYKDFTQYLHSTNVSVINNNIVGEIQIIFRHNDKMYSIPYNPDGYFIYDNKVYEIKDEQSIENINELLYSAKPDK